MRLVRETIRTEQSKSLQSQIEKELKAKEQESPEEDATEVVQSVKDALYPRETL